jgi:hypothetical protein
MNLLSAEDDSRIARLSQNMHLAYSMNFMEREDITTVMALIGDISGLKKEMRLHNRTACAAAIGGNLEILEWLYQIDAPMHLVMEAAAKNNKLNILKWGIQKGLKFGQKCLVDVIAFSSIETMEWILQHGCTLDYRCYLGVGTDLQKANWLASKGCYCTKQECHKLVDTFVSAGNLTMIKWIAQANSSSKREALEPIVYLAAVYQQKEILLWATLEGFPVSGETLEIIGETCSFKTLKEIIFHGAPIELLCPTIPQRFAWEGNLEALKWFNDNNVNMQLAYKGAFKGQNEEVIDWVLENLSVPSEKVMPRAVRYCTIEYLEKLFAKGYPITNRCYRHLTIPDCMLKKKECQT